MAKYAPLNSVPLQIMDGNGDPLSGGTLEFYLSGTTTPTNLFSNSTGTSIGTSLTLNSSGYPESGGNVITLFRDTAINYKVICKTSGGSTVWTSDTINSELGVLASTTNGEGASLIGVEDSAGNFTGADVEAVLAEIQSTIDTVDARLEVKYKTANTGRSSTSTLADDPEIAGLTLTAGNVYLLEGFLYVTQADVTAGFKMELDASQAVQIGNYGITVDSGGVSSFPGRAAQAGTPASISMGTIGSYSIMIKGIIHANASTSGDISLQWAQSTSDAGNTGLAIGSWISLRNIGSA